MGYSNFEVDAMLDSLTVLVDTREQDTPAFRRRMKRLGCPFVRQKLDFGDYACRYTDTDGKQVDMSNRFCVERKMNLDELCQCFTKGRARFEREFERAKAAGATIHLVVENACWESAFEGEYRSRLNPSALIASLLAWSIRYGAKIYFCTADTSGPLIYKILRYELKEYLERGCYGT